MNSTRSKRSLQLRDVVDIELAELDIGAVDLGGETGLREVLRVGIDSDHARGAAPLHLEGIEAGIAADIEHGLAAEVGRDGVLESSAT